MVALCQGHAFSVCCVSMSGVSRIQFEFHHRFRSHISRECSEQHLQQRALSQGSLYDYNAADVVIGEGKEFQADITMFQLVSAYSYQARSLVDIGMAISVAEC